METVVCNFAAQNTKQVIGGRKYIVAPMVLLKEGVLNGSRGALFYPANEISKNHEAWNSMPIVLNHPKVGSARTPEAIDSQGIGHVFDVKHRYGKLVGNGYFDIEAMQKIAPEMLYRLERGDQLELSTGLFTDNTEVRNGNYNGRRYTHIARNYRPDHLAILTDKVGACSISDGCGVGVLNSRLEKEKMKRLNRCQCDVDQDDCLELPVINFEQEQKDREKSQQDRPVTTNRKDQDLLETPSLLG